MDCLLSSSVSGVLLTDAINQNDKYLSSSLPFPFENREQFERSLRLPIGQEWVTKESFQDSTKPRVIIKQGIITPMSKPMVR